jgi:hypothetical protein
MEPFEFNLNLINNNFIRSLKLPMRRMKLKRLVIVFHHLVNLSVVYEQEEVLDTEKKLAAASALITTPSLSDIANKSLSAETLVEDRSYVWQIPVFSRAVKSDSQEITGIVYLEVSASVTTPPLVRDGDSSSVIDFGKIPIGQSVTQKLIVKNVSNTELMVIVILVVKSLNVSFSPNCWRD